MGTTFNTVYGHFLPVLPIGPANTLLFPGDYVKYMSFEERAPTDCSQGLLSDPTQQPPDCCSALLEPGQVLQDWRTAYRGLEESLQNREQAFSLLLPWKWKVKVGLSHRFVADASTWRGSSRCSQSLTPPSLCATVVIWIVSFIFSLFNPQILRNAYLKAKTYPFLSNAANTLHYSHGRELTLLTQSILSIPIHPVVRSHI